VDIACAHDLRARLNQGQQKGGTAYRDREVRGVGSMRLSTVLIVSSIKVQVKQLRVRE